jgi:TolB-like protein/class 3 adenylate cyclase
MPSTRQLAAIMFTDIVGYTTLMGRDEQMAFELLNKNRQIQKPIIEEFNGKFIKELGDGILASFATVSDSVYAAIKISERCKSKENITLRIGLHHGEIVFEKNDVFGDAVNIASRLQAIAPAGSIYISESIHQNVVNKQGIETVFIKEESLKNVQAPVRIYQVISEGHEELLNTLIDNKSRKVKIIFRKKIWFAAVIIIMAITGFRLFSTFTKMNGKLNKTKQETKKTIAVLPFTNMSSEASNEYFSDGITENIITHLSKITELKVIARTSSMLYKGSKKSIKEIAGELGVTTILEGSVQRSGNQVRITAQLIDAKTQHHIWADTYDRNIEQVFAIQSEVAMQIAQQLNMNISDETKKRIDKKATENITAFDHYLKGKKIIYDWANPAYFDNLEKAQNSFLEAIKLDSGFALAWAGLSFTYRQIGSLNKQLQINYYLIKSLEAGIKGIIYGPELSETHMMLGEILKNLTLNPLSSIDELHMSITLNPNNAEAHCLFAFACSEAGLFKEAEASLIKARELDPLSELMKSAWFQYYKNSRNAKGLQNYNRDFYSTDNENTYAKTYAYFLNEQYDSVFIYSKRYSYPFWLAIAATRLGHMDLAQKFIDSVKNNLISDNVISTGIIYAWLNEKDKAIDWLEKSYYMKNSNILAIKVDKLFDPLRDDKRFIDLLRKIGVE